MENRIAILDPNEQLKALSDELKVLRLKRFEETEDFDFVLSLNADGALQLGQTGSRSKPIRVDFDTQLWRKRVKSGSGKNQILAKAVGFKTSPWKVLDATAGLGGDTFALAALGCQVVAIEKSNILFALLRDGFTRASQISQYQDLIHRIEVKNYDFFKLSTGDPSLSTSGLSGSNKFDALYIDPMFPEKTKTALPSKEMQLLHSLLGSEERPISEWIQQAKVFLKPGGRIAIKRPSSAKVYPDGLVHQYKGKSIRYDAYTAN